MSTAPHLHLAPDAIYPFEPARRKRFARRDFRRARCAAIPATTLRQRPHPLPLLDQLSARYGRSSHPYGSAEPGRSPSISWDLSPHATHARRAATRNQRREAGMPCNYPGFLTR